MTEQVLQVIMTKQLRSTRTSRGRRQATSAATSKRPYTRRSQPNAPAANPPGKETRPLTTDDIATIVQQVAATLSSDSHSPPTPAATSTMTATTASHSASSTTAAKDKTTTASHTSGPEENSSTASPAILTQGDIPSLVDAVVSRLSSSQASSTTARAGNNIIIDTRTS